MANPRRLFEQDLLGNLARQFIGYNDFFNEVDHFLNSGTTPVGYPPYNVVQLSEYEVQIELAVAGFKPEEVKVSATEGILVITGNQETPREARNYSYRGISGRNFERTFRLADYWEVKDAAFENGILTVTLKQELPEEHKVKFIPVRTK